MNFEKVKKAGKALIKASSEKSCKLLVIIQENPGIFQKELSRLSGFSQVETSIRLKALVNCKVVVPTKQGTKVCYAASQPNIEKINALAALINA